MNLATSPLALDAHEAWSDAFTARRDLNYAAALSAHARLVERRHHPNPHIRRLAGAAESCARVVDSTGDAA